jgi:acyl-coenzyme A thioesterase PaaI-like protein
MGTMLELAQKMLRREIDPAPVARLVGFELISVEEGKAVVTLRADERHWNPMGTLHGFRAVYCAISRMLPWELRTPAH